MFVAVILSLCLFVVSWNAYLSWYRSFVLQETWSDNDVTKYSQKQLVAEWVKSRTVSVPLLGIHASVSDAPTLGSLSMLIIAIWFWFCARQENQVIGRLLCDTKSESDDVRKYILHSITSNMVFTTVTQYRGPIDSINVPLQRNLTVAVQFLFRILIFLPAISVTFVVAADVCSIFLQSPFRFPRQPIFERLGPKEWIHFGVETSMVLMLLVLIYVFCTYIVGYVASTALVMQEYSVHTPVPASSGGIGGKTPGEEGIKPAP
jgi:hypothetical protein